VVLVTVGVKVALTLVVCAEILKSRAASMVKGPTSWSGTLLADSERVVLLQDQFAVLVKLTRLLALKAL
jgi:hypothetical protein